jgi:hypothetical protein
MSSYIQNYGFTKTLIQDNQDNLHNEIQWQSDYDGRIANIDVDINNNGNREFVSMQLNNNELRQIFGIQPVEVTLEKRLMNDFLSHKPITLEGALIKRKSRRHRKKHHKKRKTKRLY